MGGSGQDRAISDYSTSDRDLLRRVHMTIKKVTNDIDRFHFNTAVSAIMELANAMQAYRDAHGPKTYAYSEAATSILLLLAPMTPHITAELWEQAGGDGHIHAQPWPAFNAELAAAESVEVAVQVNGKVRERIVLDAEATEEEAIAAALASEKVAAMVAGKEVRQARYVPGRLVSVVVS